MAAGTIVASDQGIQSILSLWRSLLTASSTLRLYKNNITPDPSLTWGSFSEATFTGYSPFSLNGMYPVPTLNLSGQYVMTLPAVTFTATVGVAQTIYGAAILGSGLSLWFTIPFASPVTFTPGSSYSVTVTLFEWAASTIP